jgi:hypothetical protein
VLVRIGPPYKPNDELDSSAASIAQVLLDGLSCASPFRATFGAKLPQVNSIYRNADITITMDSPPVSYKISLRSPSSPAYDGNALYDLCTFTSEFGCGPKNSTTYHYKPFMNSTTEVYDQTTSETDNFFYFKYPFSEYVLSKDSGSGTCTYSQCYVSRNGFAVKMKYVDSLVFADKEIRVFDAP